MTGKETGRVKKICLDRGMVNKQETLMGYMGRRGRK